MAVFAPMPSASVRTATTVKPGALASIRNAYLKSCSSVLILASFVPQRDHRIHPRGPVCREESRQDGDNGQQDCGQYDDQGIAKSQAKEHAADQASSSQRSGNSDGDADNYQYKTLAQNLPLHSGRFGTKSHANADITSPPRN